MLRILLISPDEARRSEMTAALGKMMGLEVVRALSRYPTSSDLLRTVRLRKPELILLDVDDPTAAKMLASDVDTLLPSLPLITFGGTESVQMLPQLMHLGVRDHLVPPYDSQALADAVGAARKRLQTHPMPVVRGADLFSFLPAKPGVGTSTIAVSTSCAAAENLALQTLLMDCDLAAGPIRFLLKLGNTASLNDAIGHAESLDEDLWAQMIGKFGKLEVLHAGRLEPPAAPDLNGLQKVLALARDQYDVICADLPSSIDPFSVAVMRESVSIFLVTTPEVVPVYLAGNRLRRLQELGLGDRVRLLLNRKTSSEFTDDDIAEAVGVPVSHTFSNDYRTVRSAILEAAPVSEDSPLGLSILDLAQSLVPRGEQKPPARTSRFLEFFHISHAHEPEMV